MALSLDFNFPCSCLCFFTLGCLGRNFIPLCLRLSFINVFRIAKFKSFLVTVPLSGVTGVQLMCLHETENINASQHEYHNMKARSYKQKGIRPRNIISDSYSKNPSIDRCHLGLLQSQITVMKINACVTSGSYS
jgi:hypothetical protein